MKLIKIPKQEFQAFEFKDLSVDKQEKIIFDEIKCIVETTPYEQMSDDMQRAIDDAEKNFTPWFQSQFIYDACKQQIINSIEINDYLFDKDGNMLNIYHYTGGENDRVMYDDKILIKIGE